MLGVITSVLAERASLFLLAAVPQCHSGLAFLLSSSFLSRTPRRREFAPARAIGAVSVAQTFRLVGVIPIAIRMARTSRSDHNSDSEAGPGAAEQVSRASDEHRQQSPIMRLLTNPALRCPIRTPRYPIVLCHGLYGFDVLGPSAYPRLQLHYWCVCVFTYVKRPPHMSS